MNRETLHIGYGALSEFIKHANGRNPIYCTISSQSHGNGSVPPSWEIQLIVQSILNEYQVAYCLMRLGSCLEIFEEKREELRQRGLSALAAVKDALQDAGFEVADAKVSMHKDLEKIAGTFDLIEYDKATDSFSYKRASKDKKGS